VNPDKFLNTIYLGDRACQSIVLESWKKEIKIKVNCISRVREEKWNFYTDEDVQEGFLVFENVQNFKFDPSGILPNDWIELVSVISLDKDGTQWEIVLSLGAVNGKGESQEVLLHVIAEAVSIENVEGARIRS
jgi:hypothetical protein